MTGLLGGLLELVNAVGGIALMVLIGGKAWSKNDSARFFRLLFGAYILGCVPGLVIQLLGWHEHQYDDPFLPEYFLGVPVVSVIATFLLERLRRIIEDSD